MGSLVASPFVIHSRRESIPGSGVTGQKAAKALWATRDDEAPACHWASPRRAPAKDRGRRDGSTAAAFLASLAPILVTQLTSEIESLVWLSGPLGRGLSQNVVKHARGSGRSRQEPQVVEGPNLAASIFSSSR